MKTQIIHLEPHDDIVSSRDKIRWAKSQRIILVFPQRGRLLYRKLDLILLKRESNSQGSELALVTKDSEVRFNALHAGIPVFKSISQAQNNNWRIPRKFRSEKNRRVAAYKRLQEEQNQIDEDDKKPASLIPERPNVETKTLHPIVRLLIFTIGVLAVLLIAATLFPSATIELNLQTQTQEMTIHTTGNINANQPSHPGSMPLYEIHVTVDGKQTKASTGSMITPLYPAIGYVQFTNLTNTPLEIPAGTLVHTKSPSPIFFTVTEGGELEAGTETTMLLPIRALESGSQGNLPAESIVAVEGIIGTKVNVTNPYPTRHGTDQEVAVPTTHDRLSITETLKNELFDTAKRKMQLESNGLLLDENIKIEEILDEEFLPEETTPSSFLTLYLKITYKGYYIAKEDIDNFVINSLDANLPSDFLPINDTLVIKQENIHVSTSDNSYTLEIFASREIQPQVSSSEIIETVRGSKTYEATQKLQTSLPLQSIPIITIHPSWWQQIPITPVRITIVFQ